MIGQSIGPYQILAELGRGGMGEVYRATDSNLKRSVAIKVLPASMASDADRLARFQREAEVLAALNHPNIAGIYGLERTPDLTALVMELVEGEDLSQRIARGAIPIDEALPIAKQIAEALEAAHEQGIIHRDLKPANVKIRPDGTVKVLDFGLARSGASGATGAIGAPGAERFTGATGASDRLNSPTITSPAALTVGGMILGTAAYMAPEQARGKAVDKRADIWAFGAVLFEMLAGVRAFAGDDITDVLAAVVRAEPEWSLLPSDLSPTLLVFLRRCLQKDARQRLGDIHDMRLALDGAFDTPASAVAPVAAPPPPARTTTLALAALASVAAIALAAVAFMWAAWRVPPAPESRRLLAGIGADAYLVASQGAAIAVSPDGKTLVFTGARKVPGSQPQLFVRALDQLQATPLDGTGGASFPFFSPDSQWIAFFVNDDSGGVLKKIPVIGGAPARICDVSQGRGGSWAEDGTIVFSQLANPVTTLMRVPAAGGTPVAFGAFGEGAITQRWPQVLPGGTHVLYTEHSAGNSFDYANLVVASASAEASTFASATADKSADKSASSTPKIVVQGGFYGRYVAIGSNGFLTYVRESTLMAMPFDLSRLEATGPAVPVVEDVSGWEDGGSASIAVSPDGTLVYQPDTSVQPASAIQWLSRDGKTSVLRAAETQWSGLRVSPDGQHLALIEADKQRRVFVHDVARDIPSQVTADGLAASLAWTPDGKRLVFASESETGVSNLWLTNADGSGSPTRLTTSPNDQRPYSWDPAGKFLAYTEGRPNTVRDVMILPVEGDANRGWKAGTPIVFKATATQEADPAFSPDGRWIAYTSLESGSQEVYVSPFPGPGPSVVVSSRGGGSPRWSAASRELLFWNDGKIMSASYAGTDTFVPGKPQLWAPQDGVARADFDLHPDGTRVAIGLVDAEARRAALYTQDKIVFWSGFADYLRKNVVATK